MTPQPPAPVVAVPTPEATAEMLFAFALASYELSVKLANIAWALRMEEERRAA